MPNVDPEADPEADREAVKRWLEDNHIDVVDERGWTPLHHAVFEGHTAAAKLLIDAGADVHAKDEDAWTPLHSAVYNGHTAAAKLLVDAGADVHAKDEEGWTPLHYAVFESAAAKLLINAGADVRAKDKKGWTPLHRAAFGGVATKLLIDAGADVHARDEEGWTPLHRAVFEKHAVAARLLIDAGADVHAKDEVGRTPLFIACTANGENKETVRALLRAGADPNVADNQGRAPITVTTNADIVLLLLDHGADAAGVMQRVVAGGDHTGPRGAGAIHGQNTRAIIHRIYNVGVYAREQAGTTRGPEGQGSAREQDGIVPEMRGEGERIYTIAAVLEARLWRAEQRAREADARYQALLQRVEELEKRPAAKKAKGGD